MIADLVMNHTSIDHPWFQEARSSPDNPKRDWYVWSDTDDRYTDARIIFVDTESSNWTWDPVAGAYYWHRFFSHQPDLNYDNPEVQDEMLKVLKFWLDLGLDGFRLDAVPYLFERDGTNCENLPETHEYLKRLRARVDAQYPDRVLLAEANQWPDDVVEYFGDGDECHMAFHFPVMPRIFMAMRREDALPIIEILDQTPPIPTGTQWGLFLRNHDELTLEMVTDEERDYMYAEYAKDPLMKLNLGIRRRLAPLLDNGRDEIELATAILFSLPGSPILYYGDEIGMGDNIYLGDRDGVRTPMQWTGDRNGGFSRADFARLYLPPLMDPVLRLPGRQRRGAAAHADSLLRWIHRFVALRKKHPVFGCGSYEVLRPANREDLRPRPRASTTRSLLCVHNIARSAQAVELDLSRFEGMRTRGDVRTDAVPPHRRVALPAHARRDGASSGSSCARTTSRERTADQRGLRPDRRARSLAVPRRPALVRRALARGHGRHGRDAVLAPRAPDPVARPARHAVRQRARTTSTNWSSGRTATGGGESLGCVRGPEPRRRRYRTRRWRSSSRAAPPPGPPSAATRRHRRLPLDRARSPVDDRTGARLLGAEQSNTSVVLDDLMLEDRTGGSRPV